MWGLVRWLGRGVLPPETHIMEGENPFLQVVLDLHVQTMASPTPTPTQQPCKSSKN